MKKIFLLFLFISSFLFAQDEIKRHPLWIDLGSGVATPKAQYNIYPFGNQLGNLGATANRWNFIYGDTTITNHLANTTWTFNSVAITTTGSQFNYLSGATGTTGTTTTNLVFSTSPVLVAPTLGVASATQILNGNGSATSPSYSFTSDTNTGIYRKGADTLGIVTNGTNVVTFAGINVGFGADNPNEKVDVNGNINIRSGYGLKVVNSGTNEIEFTGTASTTNIYSANDIYLLAASGKSLNLGAGGSNSKLVVASDGNVSIGATTSLHKTSIVSPTTANYFYGLNIVNANINKTRTTIAQSTDTANVNIKISTLGNPQFTMKGATGNTILLVDSSATSLSNALTLLDPGTSANSYAITLTADNATTPQYGSIQVMYGADPYLRISAPNDAGTATAIMDLKDQRVVIGSSAAGVDYDIYMQGETNQGTITYMEDEDRFDFDNDIKVGASLWGSAQMSGTDAFTTTATADTVTVTGATVNDIYILTYITAVTAAEAPLSVTATATGFIATRPAGTTSGASYAWMRQRK